MSERTYYQKKQKIGIENFTKKKKNIKREYGRNRYHNMSEEKKTKMKKTSKKLLWRLKVSVNWSRKQFFLII